MKLEDEADQFLQLCAERNLPVCILSDLTTEIQIRKLEKLGLQKRTQYLVTSEEVGVEKPDRRMFEAALAKLNLAPQDVVMIGDDIKKDISGAEALGIRAFLIVLRSK